MIGRVNKREEIQKKAVELLKENNHILLTWSTGVGKSKAAIECIKEYLKTNRALILCKETNHINNWIEEFKKHKNDDLLNKTDIICYNSIKKLTNKYDIVILDECHCVNQNRIDDIKELCRNNFYRFEIISLSATVDNDCKFRLKSLMGSLFEYNITTEEAINMGLLPEPVINVIQTHLNNSIIDHQFIKSKGSKAKYKVDSVNYSDRIKKLNEYKKHKITDYHLSIRCTQKQYYDLLTEELEFYRKQYFKTNLKVFENKWINKGSERKRFLAESKTNTLKLLLDNNKNKRILCFTGSINQCKLIGEKDKIIHSEIDIKDRLKIIEDFNSKKINKIYSVKMLTEGMNLTDIDITIITQIDNGDRTTIQKIGRSLRSENPIIYIISTKDTQDDKYLESSLESFKNTNYVKFIKLNLNSKSHDQEERST